MGDPRELLESTRAAALRRTQGPRRPARISQILAGGRAPIRRRRRRLGSGRELQNKFIDNAPRGESTGDRVVDVGEVVDAASGARRGVLIQTCDLAKLGKRSISACAGDIQLPAGRLSIADGGAEGGDVSTYAITGGTGAYATARGTVVFTPKGKTIGVAIHVAS